MNQDYRITAEFYDYVAASVNRQDVDFYVEEAKASGGPVLELGCGTGRILIPVARAGVEVTGLDLNAALLEQCRAKLKNEPEEVQARAQAVEGDMREFDLGREFALITTPFRAFQHLLTVEDQLACLACVHRQLRPGGRFILDVFNPHLPFLVDERYQKEETAEPPFTMPDGRRVVRKFRSLSGDPAKQRHSFEFIYYVTHPGGQEKVLRESFEIRYLFRFEAEHLLERAGFRVEDVYGDFDRSPHGTKSPGELILMANKN